MNEFWGGPFFDEEGVSEAHDSVQTPHDHGLNLLFITTPGCIMRKDLITRDRTLADTVPHLQSEDKEQFLDFAGAMLHWIPEKRSTAKELMEHPFLELPRRDYERYLQRVGRK